MAVKREAKANGVVLSKDRETKRFVRYSVEDEEGVLPLTTVYIRKGSLPNGTESVRITVEAL